ncbi:MAG: ankyrin repeat domain-containing protein [Acidobacteria bacterium]|nr:ankyrin repeat domain-containing protein [Acidobacteriota bacterium]
MSKRLQLIFLCLGIATGLSAGSGDALHNAIVRGDNAAVQKMLDEGADASAVDEAGTPAIMNAVVYGNAAMVKALIDRGAKVKAANGMGATALLWGAGDVEKARLLIAAGADVNAASGTGRTPLHVAAAAAGGAPIVKMLLDAGAKVDVKDRLDSIPAVWVGGGKGTPLLDACRVGDLASVKLLIGAGADVNATDSHNATPLSEAAVSGRKDIVRFLLDNKASVNVSVAMNKMPLLTMAAVRGEEAIVRMLVKAGAAVNARDARDNTPLMWAAYSDFDRYSIVDFLLQSGADAKAVNKMGESALDWALQRGETHTVRLLRGAGSPSRKVAAHPAMEPAAAGLSLSKTFDLFTAASDAGMKKTGCASCHNHMLPLQAAGLAAARGIDVNEKGRERMASYILAFVKPAIPVLLESSNVLPEMGVTSGYLLDAFAANNYPADKLTAAVVHMTMQQQTADGRWIASIPRPPVMSGDIQATAYAIRALRAYPLAGRMQEINRRVAMAARWLKSATPVTTEDHMMRLLGLKWAGAEAKDVTAAASQLLSMQRTDGGWAQLAGLGSDPYATGKAVYAVRTALGAKADAASMRKAAMYLRKSRLADGSWYAATRAFALQPLVDTNFPHGRDQWMAISASSWAVMGLLASESEHFTLR